MQSRPNKSKGKIPEENWKTMHFLTLYLLHILRKYEEEYNVCADLTDKLRKGLQILKGIPYIEWKIDFHYLMKLKEIRKQKEEKPTDTGMPKGDFMKIRYALMRLLYHVRTCSEKSFEKTFYPRQDLSVARKKLVKMCTQLSETLENLDRLPYREDGVEYNYVLEVKYSKKFG